jgi:hypothetical protein
MFHRMAFLVAALALCAVSAVRSAPAADATAQADTLYAHKDWKAAARAYEAITKATPQSPRPWYRLGVCYGNLAQWPKAIDAYRHAEAAGAVAQFTRYNMACAFTHAGMTDSAFAALGRLADTGYRQADQVTADSDLAPLHPDARFAAVIERIRRNATPCVYVPESRQFDFWIGDWDVRDNTRGQAVAGKSHVEAILGQCVIFENWSGLGAGDGKSFNAWNSELKCWQQNWMDDAGQVVNFTDGHYVNGVLSMVADGLDPSGQPEKVKLSFYNLGPDQVRQVGERSGDGGKTWTLRYDFNYVRVK